MYKTTTERAWDALADALETLPTTTLASITRGAIAVPVSREARMLIARRRLDVRELCRMELAHRGEDTTGHFVGWEDAARAYLGGSDAGESYGARRGHREAPPRH